MAKANGVQLSPLQLANGAKELLDEVATGKVTGEEDRYSHTDLWDFQANVEGSQRGDRRAPPGAGGEGRRAWPRARGEVRRGAGRAGQAPQG